MLYMAIQAQIFNDLTIHTASQPSWKPLSTMVKKGEVVLN